MNHELINVLLMGTAFHLIFFSYTAAVSIQETVINALKTDPRFHNFTVNGYAALCSCYIVYSLSNWLAPSIIAFLGFKYSMFISSAAYALYVASFLYPLSWLFYLSTALVGLGAGLLWTAQGGCISANSNSEVSNKYVAIFWCMLHSNRFLGNVLVYVSFNDQSSLTDTIRYIVYGVLSGVSLLGTFTFLLIRDKPSSQTDNPEDEHLESVELGALGEFKIAVRLSWTSNMLLLSSSFLLTGILNSFITAFYGAIGATSQFGFDAKKLIGLAGIFVGLGEILGGSIFGLFGSRIKFGRDSVFLFGYLVIAPSLAITFINFPADASMDSIAKQVPIIEPRVWIVIVASTLMGLADACFNTQIYSHLMIVYKGTQSVGAFALFKFVQTIGSALAFLFSSTLNLYNQIYILAVISTIATLTFGCIERNLHCRSTTRIGSQEVLSEPIEQSIETNTPTTIPAS